MIVIHLNTPCKSTYVFLFLYEKRRDLFDACEEKVQKAIKFTEEYYLVRKDIRKRAGILLNEMKIKNLKCKEPFVLESPTAVVSEFRAKFDLMEIRYLYLVGEKVKNIRNFYIICTAVHNDREEKLASFDRQIKKYFLC
jgi:hypothetical protein